MSINDAEQFLERLQGAFQLQQRGGSKPVRPSEQRQKLLDALMADLPAIESLGDAFKPLDDMLRERGASMLSVLPRPLPFPVTFGVIEARELNARSFRSKQGAVAVCLNASLPILLTKLIKLRIAHGMPASVTHYSRGSFKRMKSKDYADLARQQLLNYAVSREIRGPFIELNETMTAIAGYALDVAESFLLGHEIAHLGMAVESFGLSELSILEPLDIKAGPARDREIAADILGAMLSKKTAGNTPAASVVLAAGRLFELLTMAGDDASGHYAPPLVRMVIMLRQWFDSDTTALIVKDEVSSDLLHLWKLHNRLPYRLDYCSNMLDVLVVRVCDFKIGCTPRSTNLYGKAWLTEIREELQNSHNISQCY